MISALIPAAGSGERLGLGPKAWLKLNGKTLLERAIDNLKPFADELIIALPEEMQMNGVKVIKGGKTRQESVFKLLNKAKGDLVIIHDVARPFLPTQIIKNMLDAAKNGAATAALPAADTLILAKNDIWLNQLDRNSVRLIQTPQAFKRDLLLEAHDFAQENNINATDDAGLVVEFGQKVKLVPGDPWLLKITGPRDWEIANYLAKFWDHSIGGGI